jgi:hypothetical protein
MAVHMNRVLHTLVSKACIMGCVRAFYVLRQAVLATVLCTVVQIVGPEAGAACGPKSRLAEVVRDSKPGANPASKFVQRRFQSGAVDEVCRISWRA